ncbi:LOW QUALITY PROTEIN: hypothetical protein RJ639_027021 [Escallonia herrerae]|uniref:Rhamnogalacturonan lyase domain-containing protein n=1 Tax=Escallonia herrerae TaxID=1293975 RepID=A0AA88XIX5_9ASTE|nr:LOW QUALITY PROTEIN: hypothetical protein RJ639_027021 [Escallonia herrerae]
MPKTNVKLINQGSNVLLDNGLVRLTIVKPQGVLTGIKYGGMDNILDSKSGETSRGLRGSEYSTIHQSNDQLEVSFRSTYDASTTSTRQVPLSVDLRYILRSGVSGFHCYAIYERPPGCRAFDLVQTRMVFKLQQDKFHYMAITDDKQRIMPMPEDILPDLLLTNPIDPDLKGEVDDKYQYSMDNKDGGLHGWISSAPVIGFWVIFPSHEFRNGGPTKQNLTVHVGPACLAMFHGTHYIGTDLLTKFEQGETWRKVFGPFFVYLNSIPDRLYEVSAWPYNFVSSPYYLSAEERGSVSGRLLVQDRFVSNSLIPAKTAYVGLSAARTEGSWQLESKDYQFWYQQIQMEILSSGTLYPEFMDFMAGFLETTLTKKLVTISAGSQKQLDDLIYVPLRDGPTVWEIGIPDRTSTGFYVPDVNLMYANKLFLNSPEKFRQYGLWDRYTDIHPEFDQNFTIGINDPKKDWFFAHVARRGANKYLPTVWTINFNLTSVTSGVYKLRLAVASANRSDLLVHVNHIDTEHLVFQVMNLGTDNAVCRHGIHGLYRLLNVDIAPSNLVKGDNSIFLTQARGGDALCGILHDYLRLEVPVNSQRAEHLE